MRRWGLIFLLIASSSAFAQWLIPPTGNRALFSGEPSKFFMYVDRNFENQLTKPWEGGQYGYVRGPQRVGGKVVYGHLHEGIDIAPVQRTPAGEPLDVVIAAAAGRVVYVSNLPSASNYGRYVVIEHRLGESPYYTLYAHLKAIMVQPGQAVTQGQPIGDLGYTGDGINRERAHLHFEFCLLVNSQFQTWYDLSVKNSPNKHGIFNGMNLIGMDSAALLKGVQTNPLLTVPEFVRSQHPRFRITVNDSPQFELLRRYPWLVAPGEAASPPAWTITFSETGVPMGATAYPRLVAAPIVQWLDADIPPAVQSRGWIAGSASTPHLTDAGKRFLNLLTLAP